MNFPETRHSLIQRLATEGDEEAWRHFTRDYWGPIERFAAYYGGLTRDQAEDVAADTLMVLVKSEVLQKWSRHPQGRFRSLMCGVVKKVLANLRRVQGNRARLLRELADTGGGEWVLSGVSGEPGAEELDIFYREWANELLVQVLRRVARELHAEGKGNYFRALFGRICEGMSQAELAASLEVSVDQVENFLRAMRKRLTELLKRTLAEQIARYADQDDAQSVFAQEWVQLSDYLSMQGDVERAVRLAYEDTPGISLFGATISPKQMQACKDATESLGRANESRRSDD